MDVDKIAFGGSCHWCTEAIFASLIGVKEVEQGWVKSIQPYDTWSEAVVVHYDPKTISLNDLIEVHLHTHSCTNNHSMRVKYRSAVYYYSFAQKEEALNIVAHFQNDFTEEIITQVLSHEGFNLNKESYLDYYYSNPDKPFCQNVISPKLGVLLAKFRDKVDERVLKDI